MTAALEPWRPLSPSDVADLLAACPVAWWVAGGYAIDAFVDDFDRRPHGDIDVGLLAADQHALRGCLRGWDAWCADPPGTLRPWMARETLAEPVHDVWLRPTADAAWQLALVLNTHEDDTWTYRRDPRVRRPVSELVWRRDGMPFLVPEVQLLFKAKTVRAKDQKDFDDTLPLLTAAQREWLGSSLALAHPGHPWLGVL